VAGDVSNVADIRRLVDEALSVRGQIDVLINNAGITGSHAATMSTRTSVDEFGPRDGSQRGAASFWAVTPFCLTCSSDEPVSS